MLLLLEYLMIATYNHFLTLNKWDFLQYWWLQDKNAILQHVCRTQSCEGLTISFTVLDFLERKQPEVRPNVSQNYEVLPGRDLWRSPSAASYSAQDCHHQQIKSGAALSFWALANSEDGELMISLENLLYSSPAEEGFLMFKVNVSEYNWWMLPFIHPWFAFTLMPTIICSSFFFQRTAIQPVPSQTVPMHDGFLLKMQNFIVARSKPFPSQPANTT